MNDLHINQIAIADVFHRMDAINIICFRSSMGTRYVSCDKNNEKWVVSFSEKDPGKISYIFTINGLFRFITNQFGEIMLEFEKLAYNPKYIIPTNEHAMWLINFNKSQQK
jgi:hypothetical protein